MKNTIGLLILSLLLVACGTKGGTNSGPSSNGSTVLVGAQGTINGGGGVGILCADHLELLDLHEAKKSGLTPVEAPLTEKEASLLTANLIAYHFWNPDTIPASEVAADLSKNMITPIFEGEAFKNVETQKNEKVHFVDSLPLSMDYGKYDLPKGCTLKQIAFFSDKNTELSIVKSAWDKLDWLSRSMLATHEVIYMVYRREGLNTLLSNPPQVTSAESRRFVGRLFSTTSLRPKAWGIPKRGEYLTCRAESAKESEDTYFYAFTDASTGKLRVVFNVIFGRSSLYQATARFSDFTLDTLQNENSEMNATAKLSLTDVNLSVTVMKSKGQKPLLRFNSARVPEQAFTCSKP